MRASRATIVAIATTLGVYVLVAVGFIATRWAVAATAVAAAVAVIESPSTARAAERFRSPAKLRRIAANVMTGMAEFGADNVDYVLSTFTGTEPTPIGDVLDAVYRAHWLRGIDPEAVEASSLSLALFLDQVELLRYQETGDASEGVVSDAARDARRRGLDRLHRCFCELNAIARGGGEG